MTSNIEFSNSGVTTVSACPWTDVKPGRESWPLSIRREIYPLDWFALLTERKPLTRANACRSPVETRPAPAGYRPA